MNDDTLNRDVFKVTYNKGRMQLYLEELSFISDNHTLIYNGEALTGSVSDVTKTSGELHSGYTYVITPTGSITNVGRVSNSFRVTILKDGDDYTSYYKINYSFGGLTVKPCEITITAGSKTISKSELPLGESLTCNEIFYDETILANNGHRIQSYVVEGEINQIGYCDNELLGVVIVNESGQVVTNNYHILCVNGLLTITT